MLALDKNAVICDLAETYHIFNYRQLPPKLLATLVVGLRDDSRIKMKLEDSKASLDRILLISILDHLKMLLWLNSNDGAKGTNKPKPLLNSFLDIKEKKDIRVFRTSEEFEKERQRIVERSRNGN